MSVFHSSDSTDFDGDIPKFKLTSEERVHDISKELISLDSQFHAHLTYYSHRFYHG